MGEEQDPEGEGHHGLLGRSAGDFHPSYFVSRGAFAIYKSSIISSMSVFTQYATLFKVDRQPAWCLKTRGASLYDRGAPYGPFKET